MMNLSALLLAVLLAVPFPALAQTGRAGTVQPILSEPAAPVAVPGAPTGSVSPTNLAPSLALPNALPSALPSIQPPAAKPSAQPAAAAFAAPAAGAAAASLPSATPASADKAAATAVAPPAPAVSDAAPVETGAASRAAQTPPSGTAEALPRGEKGGAVDAKTGRKRIDTRFEELRRAFAPRGAEDVDAAASARDAQPSAREQSGRRAVEAAAGRFEAQVSAMNAELGNTPVLSTTILQAGRQALAKILRLVEQGVIAPQRTRIRASADEAAPKPEARTLRIGVYPVAADPFQWAHILIGLRAVAELNLDKVVFVLAGDDVRKPNMTEVAFRHPMGRAVLDQFSPLFQYSSIAVGTTFDGETNIFRMLELNPLQKIDAFYIVGGDHYRFTDAKGNDDTLNKIAKKLADPKLIDRSKHSVSLAFVERDEPLERLQTSLDVHFLKDVGFEASSTQVRKGNYELMPWAAYAYVKKHRPGLYGIGLPNPN